MTNVWRCVTKSVREGMLRVTNGRGETGADTPLIQSRPRFRDTRAVAMGVTGENRGLDFNIFLAEEVNEATVPFTA